MVTMAGQMVGNGAGGALVVGGVILWLTSLGGRR